jgi:hypothetical protein
MCIGDAKNPQISKSQISKSLNPPYPHVVRFLVSSIAAMTVVLSLTLAAQAPLNFAGTWIFSREKTSALVVSRTAGPGAAATGSVSADGGFTGVMPVVSAGNQEQTITQSATSLTIERQLPSGLETLRYNLDGSESVNHNGRTTLTTTSSWKLDTLVTKGTQVTTTDRGAISNTFMEVRTIDDAGDMVIETTRQFDSGGLSTTLVVLVKRK